MTRLGAHLICLGLVAADLLARAWRIRCLLLGAGHRISLGRAVAINAVGDAACALTPLRIGGEPARVAGLLRSGVPLRSVAPAIAAEIVTAWPVLALFAAWLGLQFAPAWWRTAAPLVGSRLLTFWPWELAAAAACLLAWGAARRWRGRLEAEPLRDAVLGRPMSLWPIVASAPMSLVNVASRAAILPVLVLTLPVPPDVGVAAFASLALLYGQLVLPTPSGAGVVDIALLAGMAGPLGHDARWILGAWRFYTVGAGVVLGGVCSLVLWGNRVGAASFGWRFLTAKVRLPARERSAPREPA